jgi:hypothetical protein
MASSETKSAVSAAKSKASATLARVRAQAGKTIEQARLRTKKQDQSTRGMVLVGIAGQHAAGLVSGQIHFKYGAEKPGAVKFGLLGASAAGAYLAATSSSKMTRTVGLGLTGLGIGHLAIQSSKVDYMAEITGGDDEGG